METKITSDFNFLPQWLACSFLANTVCEAIAEVDMLFVNDWLIELVSNRAASL